MDGYDRQPQDRDVNGSNMDGYNWYRIYFYIFVRIRSWILIVLVLVKWDCNGYRHHINETFSIQIRIGYGYWISRIGYGRIKNLSNRIEFEYGRKILVLFTSVHKCMWKILDWTGVLYWAAKLLLGIEFSRPPERVGHSGFMKLLPEWGHTTVKTIA